MDKQNINLVTVLPARQSVYLSFRFVKVVFSSLLGLMLIVYLLFYTLHHFRAQELITVTKERADLKNEVEKILEISEKSNVSESLIHNIENLKLKIAEQNRVLKVLDTEQRSRFSVYLETLAQIIPNEIWLDQIQIVPEKEFISLMGYALYPAVISVFTQQLSDNAVYRAYIFKSVEVKDTKENYFRFVMTSKKVAVEKPS